MNMKIIVFVSTGIHPSLNLYSIICEPSSCNVETLTMERFLLSSISNRYHSSCACLLHPKSRNQGKVEVMHLVPAPAVRLKKRRVLSRPGVNSLLALGFLFIIFINIWSLEFHSSDFDHNTRFLIETI